MRLAPACRSLLVAATLLVGCSNDPEPKTNNGTNNSTNNDTNNDTTSEVCTLDADCAGGEACEGSQCVAVCADDTDCLVNEICAEGQQTRLTVCQTGEPPSCTFDADCADGEACEGIVCVPTCTSDADCLAGEICREGINTELNVCQVGSSDSCIFDADCLSGEACEESECVPTCDSDADCGINEVCGEGINTDAQICQPDGSSTLLYTARIQSTTTDAGSCEDVDDPGPDIFGVGLESASGETLGWGVVEWDQVQLDGNDHTDTSVIDGNGPDLGSAGCPDQFDGSVVALGCDADSYIIVSFIDSNGSPVALDSTADQVIRVYEWGGQCTTGSLDDTYDLDLCTDTNGAKGGDDSSCTVALLIDAAGESAADVAGF